MTVTQAKSLRIGDIVRGNASKTYYTFLESETYDRQDRCYKRTYAVKLWVRHFSERSGLWDKEDEHPKYGIMNSAFSNSYIRPEVITHSPKGRYMTLSGARTIRRGDLVRLTRGSSLEQETIFRVEKVHEKEKHARGVYQLDFSLVSLKYSDLVTTVNHKQIKEVMRYPEIIDFTDDASSQAGSFSLLEPSDFLYEDRGLRDELEKDEVLPRRGDVEQS
jgi:hypothetical protein